MLAIIRGVNYSFSRCLSHALKFSVHRTAIILLFGQDGTVNVTNNNVFIDSHCTPGYVLHVLGALPNYFWKINVIVIH